MLYLLKRHPVPIVAFFRHSLVLTYAFPRYVLQPLLPPGLVLDTYGEYGFVAIALVQTERLRPSFLPAMFGHNFFLSGYRIFTRLRSAASSRRGLLILRSDTDKRFMVHSGNLLTHYRYRLCQAERSERAGEVRWCIRTPRTEADLDVLEYTGEASLPANSPFQNAKDARRFAGPLPYTFDYEPQSQSIISVRGMREAWDPKPVRVAVSQNTFLERPPFHSATPILASAFRLQNVPYRWGPGVATRVETQ